MLKSAVISAKAYDRHVEQLFEVLSRVSTALRGANIEYRVIGGIAVYLYVAERDELAARMTRDIDLDVDRCELGPIAEAVRPYGFALRHVAGIDKLADSVKPSARSAVHLVMAGEKVRPTDIASHPGVIRASRDFRRYLARPDRGLTPDEAHQFPLQRQSAYQRHARRRTNNSPDRSIATG